MIKVYEPSIDDGKPKTENFNDLANTDFENVATHSCTLDYSPW